MHSALVRLQNVFGFFTTVAFTVAAVIALSSFISPQTPRTSISLRNVQVVKGRPHYYSYKKEEYANVRFDLDADLSTLFNWNTKQVFLYLKAIYPSPRASEPPSEAIIWDAILASSTAPWNQLHFVHPDTKTKTGKKSVLPKKSKKAQAAAKAKGVKDEKDLLFPRGELHLHNQRPKYQITDITGKLQNRTDVYLELGWNVQPWVGALTWTNWQKFGAWEGFKGGRSATFEFPEIGAKMKKVKKEDLETEKGSEGYRLMAGEEQPRKSV
ncbi:signal peptidase subunit 3 [Parastagonospora nodorum]|nr:signal peptidase subunit 3 [Parastagonospora nodorum]KAH4294275.1 signal peptidase subunit 3 [Parastagonospora nodorum]KAH4297216.1 signal peptidase subunit 3 [Parastagonospora nodorum]KAH4325674.1 signal peptidase subunit 3 [Parastagonospora nodorum]KAH4363250.1 signal peptidase subunit 3 [Parastagonospora nodorum]